MPPAVHTCVGRWGVALPKPGADPVLGVRRPGARVPRGPGPCANHPLVTYTAPGRVFAPSVLDACTNTAFCGEGGGVSAVGPLAVHRLVMIHNAWATGRKIAPAEYAHLTNSRVYTDRLQLAALRRRLKTAPPGPGGASIAGLTCTACARVRHTTVLFPAGARVAHGLCGECLPDYASLGGRHLVPIGVVRSCFLSNAAMSRLVDAFARTTKEAVLGTLLPAGPRARCTGSLVRMQPLGAVALAARPRARGSARRPPSASSASRTRTSRRVHPSPGFNV